jgi:uncharacterized protein YifN (PemK superfamily)
MPLPFQPHQGTIWMCDFNTGFKAPEMVKRRPVVVISPPPKRMIHLCTVVPLSTRVPAPIEPFHHQMDPRSLLGLHHAQDSWAKCDMLYTVSLKRLNWVRGRNGPGRIKVLDEDLNAIRQCVRIALGLDTPPSAVQ